MAPKFRFSDGEKVLCFHGPLLYEAKCLKSQVKDKLVRYFIHYSGWNKNWDEWVPESRVLKFNDANMQKQKELAAANSKVKKTKAVKGSKKEPTDRESTALPPQEKTPKQKNKEAAAALPTPTPTETQAAELQKKKRTRAEQNVETEEEYTQKLEIKVKIHDELKHRIVDDWDYVTRQKKLVQLPARVSIETLLSDYIKQRVALKGMTPNKESAIIEVMNGIKEYFNVMLGKQLLYNIERPQYTKLMLENPDMTPSHIYGAIHLLRLFTKIGGALAYTPLTEDSINVITVNITELQKYIAKGASSFFSHNDYVAASPEYLKKTG